MIIYANYGTRVFLCVKYHENCDNYSSQSCFTLKIERTHTHNDEHMDITSIIIISDFSGFLHKLCKLCKIELLRINYRTINHNIS